LDLQKESIDYINATLQRFGGWQRGGQEG